MYVYVWKAQDGTPFYVGMSKNVQRPNPKQKGGRNKDCIAAIQAMGADAVIIELHITPNADAAKKLEQTLIAKYGRLSDGSGSLTNRSAGGEFHRLKETTRTRLKALWQDADHREKVLTARTGQKRNLPESTKDALRAALANNPDMKGWGERNGKDASFDTKRIEGIRAAQPKRAEKMRDPIALAQRKAKLTATLNSPEHKARRAAQNTPEYRAAASARTKEYWAKKRAESVT
jgi:hypothetical protein